MIAKSDLIILVVSSTLLGIAVYRWDQNTRNVDTSTVLANTRVSTQTNTIGTDPLTEQNQEVTAADLSQADIDTVTVITTEAVTVEPIEIEPAGQNQVHIVRSGDSLSEIAASYNTSVQELQELNSISGSTIFIGQEILYPINPQ